MSKELEPLEALCYLDDIAHGRKMKYDPHELKLLIESALKEKEKQDKILNVLQESIKYKTEFKPCYCPDEKIDIFPDIMLDVQNFIGWRKQQLLRSWVLETCFPKELKALEIIKEKMVNIFYLMNVNSAEEYNIGLDLAKAWRLTQEEFDLLKEVLK